MPLPPSAARLLATASLSLCCLALPRAACGAERATISLDLTTESGFPINGAPEWNRLLGELGVSNVRIHSGQSLQVSVEESTSGRGAHRYRVLGVLHANGQLELPGGSFRSSDRAGLKRWLDRLNDQGKEGVTVAPGPFGLLPSQLEQINDDLEQPVAVSTGTLSASRALQAIGGKLKYRLRVDRQAAALLQRSEKPIELKGLSAGTALAMLARSANCALTPGRGDAGRLEYTIVRRGRDTTGWPIGRDLGSQGASVLPGLYQTAEVEIADTRLSEVLSAVQQQLEVPLFFDQYALSREQIDVDRQIANLPARNTTFAVALRRVLGKARLVYELRVDERGQPFLWITTAKKID